MADEPIHVFIDTNVFLSFYAFTNDDVEELRKLIGLIKSGRIRLYLPGNVVDEFRRNREVKLADSLSKFERADLPKAVPRMMSGQSEAADYQAAVAAAGAARKALIQKARQDAEDNRLGADILVTELFEVASAIPITDAMVQAASARQRSGSPPGKPGDFGDRLNWEAVLAMAAPGTDLHVVSRDSDYQSPLLAGKAREYLIEEWQRSKEAALELHLDIKAFLSSHFPEIKFAADIEEQAAIEAFSTSKSFVSTHSSVAKLEQLIDALNMQDIEVLLHAVINNEQVSWIATDSDVRAFVDRLLTRAWGELDENVIDTAAQAAELIKDGEKHYFPF